VKASALPIIIITACGDAATLRHAKEAGADGVFGKPIDFAALKAINAWRRVAYLHNIALTHQPL